jgi:hypothetical protein
MLLDRKLDCLTARWLVCFGARTFKAQKYLLKSAPIRAETFGCFFDFLHLTLQNAERHLSARWRSRRRLRI